jgi:hypothetical protein
MKFCLWKWHDPVKSFSWLHKCFIQNQLKFWQFLTERFWNLQITISVLSWETETQKSESENQLPTAYTQKKTILGILLRQMNWEDEIHLWWTDLKIWFFCFWTDFTTFFYSNFGSRSLFNLMSCILRIYKIRLLRVRAIFWGFVVQASRTGFIVFRW